MASTLALYNLDDALDTEAEQVGAMGRRNSHLTLSALASAWLSYELFQLGTWFSVVILMGLLVCAAYSVRWTVCGYSRGIKFVPGVKAPFIGTAVATAVILVPWASHASQGGAQHPNLGTIVLLLSLACFCTANAQLFDLPDLRQDRAAGVPTIAVRRGSVFARGSIGLYVGLGTGMGVLVGETARLPLLGLGVALLVACLTVQPTTPKSKVALWVDATLGLPLIVKTMLH